MSLTPGYLVNNIAITYPMSMSYIVKMGGLTRYGHGKFSDILVPAISYAVIGCIDTCPRILCYNNVSFLILVSK